EAQSRARLRAALPRNPLPGKVVADVARRRNPRRKRSRVPAIRSTGHAWKLRDVQRLCPFEAALGKHLQLRFDAVRLIQTADRNEDHAWEALQIAAEDSSTAVRTEVPVKSFSGLCHVVERLRFAADQLEIILRHAEEHGRFST